MFLDLICERPLNKQKMVSTAGDRTSQRRRAPEIADARRPWARPRPRRHPSSRKNLSKQPDVWLLAQVFDERLRLRLDRCRRGLAHGFAGRKKRRYYVVEKGPKAGRLEPSRYCRQGLRVWHLMRPSWKTSGPREIPSLCAHGRSRMW